MTEPFARDRAPRIFEVRWPSADVVEAVGDVSFGDVPWFATGTQPNGGPLRVARMTLPCLHATMPARLLLGTAIPLVLSGCANHAVDHTSDPAAATRIPAGTPAASSPNSGQDPVSVAPQLITYADGESVGAEVRTIADANHLAGAPESFKKFIGRTAERLARGAVCEGGYVGVAVKTLRTDGYAVGAVNQCGGYVALWAIVDGDWKEIAATQDLWDCAVLAEHRVPSDVAGDTCYDRDDQAQHSYQQA